MIKHKKNIALPIGVKVFLKFLKLDAVTIYGLLRKKKKFYYSFEIPKANGGKRLITPSVGRLKEIQTITKVFIDQCIRWPSYVHGGIKKRSVVTNAKNHVGKYMVMNLDVRKCFPSTSRDMIEKSLICIGYEQKLASMLADICEFNNELPQGAPTSTAMVNLVLDSIDRKFYPLCKKRKFKYSRFVDDITISADSDISSLKGLFTGFIESSGYSVSKYSHIKRNKAQVVTGLVVNEKLRPTTMFVRQLKKDIRNCWPEEAGVDVIAGFYGFNVSELKNNLWGRINFVKSVNKKLGRSVRGLMTEIDWLNN